MITWISYDHPTPKILKLNFHSQLLKSSEMLFRVLSNKEEWQKKKTDWISMGGKTREPGFTF